MDLDIKLQYNKYFKRVKQIALSLILNDTWKQLKPCDILVLAHENDRSYKYDNLYYSHILDTISWYLINSKYKFEIQSVSLPFSKIGHNKSYGSPKTLNRAMFLAKCRARLLGRLSICTIKSKNSELDLWLAILKVSTPRVVIAIQPPAALCNACRSIGVDIFDYQHGVINEANLAYGSRYVANVVSADLPTGYFCWDEDSADVIRNWAHNKGISVFVQGNPWMSRFIYPESTDLLVANELSNIENAIARLKESKRNRKLILVTLQPSLDLFFPSRFPKNKFISDSLLEVIESSQDVLWLIRLHPIQMKDITIMKHIIQFFSKYDNVEITHSSAAALPALLYHVHGHITWSSSVVMEASCMGLHSFIMDPLNETLEIKKSAGPKKVEMPYYKEIEDRNLATRAKKNNCADEINEWMALMCDRKKPNHLIHFSIDLFIENLFQIERR